jgi:hypothetical protein
MRKRSKGVTDMKSSSTKPTVFGTAIAIILVAAASPAFSQTPDVIHYRGHLDVPTVVPAGTVQRDLTFSLYEMEVGGSPIWTETQTLDIYDGNFAAVLGLVNSVTEEMFSGEYRYLGVQVGADPELAPRQRIAAVPYAMVASHAIKAASADDADVLDGGVIDSEVIIPGYPYRFVNVNGSIVARDGATFQDNLRVGFEEPRIDEVPETMHVTTSFPEGQSSDRRRFMVSTSEIYPSGSVARTTHLVVDRHGNVGINDLHPNGTLDVNGTIYQRGAQIHADYVFEDDFEIDTIEGHAEKMWDAKHLPGVPSREYDDEGREMVEIGRQRSGILEELEIAHIYIEQLNKQIKELREEVRDLKEQVRNGE